MISRLYSAVGKPPLRLRSNLLSLPCAFVGLRINRAARLAGGSILAQTCRRSTGALAGFLCRRASVAEIFRFTGAASGGGRASFLWRGRAALIGGIGVAARLSPASGFEHHPGQE